MIDPTTFRCIDSGDRCTFGGSKTVVGILSLPEDGEILVRLKYDVTLLSGNGAIFLYVGMIKCQNSFLDGHINVSCGHIENIDVDISTGDVEMVELENSTRRLMNDGTDAFRTIDREVTPEGISVKFGSCNAGVRIREGVVDEQV